MSTSKTSVAVGIWSTFSCSSSKSSTSYGYQTRSKSGTSSSSFSSSYSSSNGSSLSSSLSSLQNTSPNTDAEFLTPFQEKLIKQSQGRITVADIMGPEPIDFRQFSQSQCSQELPASRQRWRTNDRFIWSLSQQPKFDSWNSDYDCDISFPTRYAVLHEKVMEQLKSMEMEIINDSDI